VPDRVVRGSSRAIVAARDSVVGAGALMLFFAFAVLAPAIIATHGAAAFLRATLRARAIVGGRPIRRASRSVRQMLRRAA
jgi:hypothetical protein